MENVRIGSPWWHYPPNGKAEYLITVTDDTAFIMWVICFGAIMLLVQTRLWSWAKSVVDAVTPLNPDPASLCTNTGDQRPTEDQPLRMSEPQVDTYEGRFLGR
jgi:hypothetical protein